MLTRTIVVAGRAVLLYSRDGGTWSSEPRDLDDYAERIDAACKPGPAGTGAAMRLWNSLTQRRRMASRREGA
jgi:hypothetical protein